MPSRIWSLFATWWYTDIGFTPSDWASERIVSEPIPPSSAISRAALQHPVPAERGPFRGSVRFLAVLGMVNTDDSTFVLCKVRVPY